VASTSDELLTVKVRYKDPDGDASRLLSRVVAADAGIAPAHAADFDFASAVAGFGMLLRDAPEKGRASWGMVRDLAARGLSRDPGGWRSQFRELVLKAEGLRSGPDA
jgi:Ca-activated chloride channel family protein